MYLEQFRDDDRRNGRQVLREDVARLENIGRSQFGQHRMDLVAERTADKAGHLQIWDRRQGEQRLPHAGGSASSYSSHPYPSRL